MSRKMLKIPFLSLYVMLLFFLPNVSDADQPWVSEKDLLENLEKDMDLMVKDYKAIRDAMDTLNGTFESNRKKVALGAKVTLTATGGAIISAAVAFISGGSLAPAAFAGYLAAEMAKDTVQKTWKSSKYISGMGSTLSAMDSALSNVTAAYSGGTLTTENGDVPTTGYYPAYQEYLEACATHLGLTVSALDTLVNMDRQYRGYYHPGDSGSGDNHTILRRLTYKHWDPPVETPAGYDWDTMALEAKYKCKGACAVMFRSAYEAWDSHRKTCGWGSNIDHFIRTNDNPLLIQAEYERRGVDEGCGRAWYTCSSVAAKKAERHKVRTCAKTYTNSSGVSSACVDTNNDPVKFRICLGMSRDHNESDRISFKSVHSDVADSSSPVVSPTPTPTPTDGTPNCPDCTSHCSSPCNCTNLGTCNGTVTDNTPDCSYCTDGCSSCDSPTDGTPNCPDCTSHCSSPCSCSNSGTCNGSVYTPPTPPTPTPSPPPPTTVACGGAAWTGCTAAVSSRTEHKVASCSNCGKHYWTCMSGAVDRHTDVKTCKRSGCGASLTRCQNGPGLCVNGGYHWL